MGKTAGQTALSLLGKVLGKVFFYQFSTRAQVEELIMPSVSVTGKARYTVKNGKRVPARGKDWYVVVDHGVDAAGRRRRDWSRKFATEREAKRHRDSIANEVAQATWQQPSRERLADFVVGTWLPAVRADLRPSTWASYNRYLRLHVLPALGGTRLRDLTPQSLNLLYAGLLAHGRKDTRAGEGLSPRSVRYVHTIVHRVLRDAERWGLIAHNPAKHALPGRAAAVRRPERRTWTEVEIRAFLEGSRNHRGRGHAVGDRLFAGWVLLITTGLRRGELLGLRWRDVDLERGVLSVRQTVIVVERDARNEVAFGEPKTDSGRRIVALDTGTMAVLRTHRLALADERRAASCWFENDLVVPARDGRPFHPERFSREFRTRCERYGVPPIRLHDLRHTHATLALQHGVHPKIVSERLGHSGVSITLDLYSHVSAHLQAEAVEQVAGALGLLAGSYGHQVGDPDAA